MDDFDKYYNWSRKPNDFILHYHAREMGSYEVLDCDPGFGVDCADDNAEESDADLNGGPTIYRVRSFRRTHNGFINVGNQIKTCSSQSLNLTVSTVESQGTSLSSPEENPSKTLPYIPINNSQDDIYMQNAFKVLVVGNERVGKTSLCDQFLSSESETLDEYETNPASLKKVTVDLDGKEWNLNFRDSEDIIVKDIIQMSPDVILIIYSIENKESFEWCSEFLQDNFNQISSSIIFVVGNKSDLERQRQISSDKGRKLADCYDGEFTEVSSILNHMVDHLLIEIVTKLRNLQYYDKDNDIKIEIPKKKNSIADNFVNFFRKLSKSF